MGLSTLAPFFFFLSIYFTSLAQRALHSSGGALNPRSPHVVSWPFHSLHQVVSTISFCTARMLLIRRSCARLPRSLATPSVGAVPVSPFPRHALCRSCARLPRSLATPSVGAVPVSPFPRHALRRSCARLPVPSPRPPSELCPSPRSLATPSVGAVPVSPFPRHALRRSCARLPVPSPRPLSELCPSPRSLATPSVGAETRH